jgi:tape measure domain-containing protein
MEGGDFCMSSIDERVVNMKFNNAQFLSGITQTLSSLDNLKNGLKLDGATKGLENLDAAGKKIDLSRIADGVENISSHFSALGILGISVLTNLASKATDMGLAFVKSLSGIDSMKAGFASYQDTINATQTILANVQMHGHDLNDVTNVLNTLQDYANKTVYSFSDMTKNISLFTAAGVDLNSSVDSIKGLDNLAAASGVGAQKASDAMYQLSQAISSGSVKLQDWNSLQQAGLAGQDFQNALIANAKAHGVAVDGMIKKEGSFRDSLKDGWLTTKVLTDTLSQYTGDLSDAQLKSMGYSEQQVADIQKVAKTAVGAATNIRTVDQMMEALHEEVATAWAGVFKVLIGDLPTATTLLTGIHNTLENIFTAPAKNLTVLLQEWDKLGGRAELLDALKLGWDAIVPVVQAVQQAFREVFPPKTAEDLKRFTDAFHVLMEQMQPYPAQIDQIKTIAKALFDIFDIGVLIIQKIWGQIERLGKDMSGAGDGVLGFATNIAVLIIKFHDWLLNGELLNHLFTGMGDVLVFLLNVVQFVGRAFGAMWDGIKSMKLDGFNAGLQTMGHHLATIDGVGTSLTKFFTWLPGALSRVMAFFGPIGQAIGEQFGHIGETIADNIRNANFSGIEDALNTGIFAFIALAIRRFLKGGMSVDLGGGIFGQIKETFEGLTGVLTSMQQQLKADVLEKIAIAVGILTVSVVALSMIDSGKLTSALTAMGVMFGQLLVGAEILSKVSGSSGFAKMPIIATSLMILAVAIDLLALAVAKLSGLSWEQLLKGLSGVAVLLASVAGAAKLMSGVDGKLVSAGLAMIGIAIAINILADAVKKFSALDTAQLIKGIGSVTVVLGLLSAFSTLTDPSSNMIETATGMVILGAALKIIASAVRDFSGMSWEELARGLSALAGSLLVLVVALNLMKGTIAGSAALVIAAAAMKVLAPVLKDMGSMPWDNIGRGMVVLGGALGIMAIGLNLMSGALPGAAALVVAAGALWIINPILKDMGDMPWDNIGRAMVVLAGSLGILAVSLTIMDAALPGAAALIIAAGALAILAPVLELFGHMTWDEIGRGLTMLASTLGILALAGILILPAIPGLILLGTAILLLGAGTLAAGVGLLAFSAGLTAFAIAGTAGTAALVAMVTALLGLVPYAFTQIGLGIVAFAKVIGDAAPQFVEAAVKLMLALLQAINQTAPQVIKTLMNLIGLLLTAIKDNLPNFLQSGIDIIVSFLNGIANNMESVITAAVNVVVNFLNGIANNLGRIIDAGTNLVVKFIQGVANSGVKITNAAGDAIVTFVNGVANSIRTHTSALNDAGANLAGAIIDGLTGGLASKVGNVVSEAMKVGGAAIAAIKKAVDSNSPSKKAHEIGTWVSEGLGNGIAEMSYHVENAASGVGENALDSLKNTLSGVGSKISLTMDTAPVIRPVLDLSGVQKTASGLTGMLTPPKLTVADNYNKASYISATTAETQGINSTASNTGVSATGQPVVFTQNNYSPVALSATEIYRQTNNQLSVLQKGVTVGAATS